LDQTREHNEVNEITGITGAGLGNWRGFREDPNGCGSFLLDQTRTHNAVNEITGISESQGPSWVDPIYDAAGNMISGPKGDNPTTKIHMRWDAWNRLTAAYADNGGSVGTLIASYQYDGRNYRIRKSVAGDAIAFRKSNGVELTIYAA